MTAPLLKTWITDLRIHVIAESADAAEALINDRLEEGPAVITQEGRVPLYATYINVADIGYGDFEEGYPVNGEDWKSGQAIYVAYRAAVPTEVVGWWADAKSMGDAMSAHGFGAQTGRIETITVPFPIEDRRSIDQYLASLAVSDADRLRSAVHAIAYRKRAGQDCTADESAMVMRYFDHVNVDEQGSLGGDEIAETFPLELAQWAEEKEAGHR